MGKIPAAIGSLLFLVVVPGVVAGLIPWELTGWRLNPYAMPVQLLGFGIAAAGVAVILGAFARFVWEGSGTPAPVAATERLVVGGLYRYVRNPMYLAVGAVILGQAVALGQPVFLGYLLAFTLAVISFVYGYAQPRLTPWEGPASRSGNLDEP